MSRSAKSSLKKSLYGRRLSEDEIKALGAMPVLDVDAEIGYQRALINRLGQILENNGLAADSTAALSSETQTTIRLMNEAMGRLLTYLRLRDTLKDEAEELREEIERGKMIGRQRRHVFDYFAAPGAKRGESRVEPARKPRRKKKG